MSTPYELSSEQIKVFWSRVQKNGACWMWTGASMRKGYGYFNVGRRSNGTPRNEYAHRIAYQLTVSPIPHGYCLHHACPLVNDCSQHKLCVNPAFLTPMPAGEHSRLEHKGLYYATCKYGHLLTDESVLVDANGNRHCRVCAETLSHYRKTQARANLILQRQTVKPMPRRTRRQKPLTARTWDIIKRWLNGETLESIGAHYGFSREYARQILAKAGYSQKLARTVDIAQFAETIAS